MLCQKNKREQLRRKNISFSMLELEVTLSWMLVIGVQYDMKVKRNLWRQLGKHRPVSRIFFFDARNPSLFSSTKQATFHAKIK